MDIFYYRQRMVYCGPYEPSYRKGPADADQRFAVFNLQLNDHPETMNHHLARYIKIGLLSVISASATQIFVSLAYFEHVPMYVWWVLLLQYITLYRTAI